MFVRIAKVVIATFKFVEYDCKYIYFILKSY